MHRPWLGRFGPIFSNIGPKSPNTGRRRADTCRGAGQVWPGVGRAWGEFGKTPLGVRQTWAGAGQCGPMLANIGLRGKTACGPECEFIAPMAVRRATPKLSRNSSVSLNFDSNRQKLDEPWPNLAEFGCTCKMSAVIWPSLTRIRPKLEKWSLLGHISRAGKAMQCLSELRPNMQCRFDTARLIVCKVSPLRKYICLVRPFSGDLRNRPRPTIPGSRPCWLSPTLAGNEPSGETPGTSSPHELSCATHVPA